MLKSQFSVKLAQSVLRRTSADFSSKSGAGILKEAAQIGSFTKSCVVIVDHPHFNTSSYGYESRVVLVDTSKIPVPKEAKKFGTELGRMETSFALLKPEAVKLFLRA